jgi:hypothetical protein
MLASLATWEAEVRSIMVPGQAGQKCSGDPYLIRKILAIVVCACHPSYSREHNVEELWSRPI